MNGQTNECRSLLRNNFPVYIEFEKGADIWELELNGLFANNWVLKFIGFDQIMSNDLKAILELLTLRTQILFNFNLDALGQSSKDKNYNHLWLNWLNLSQILFIHFLFKNIIYPPFTYCLVFN